MVQNGSARNARVRSATRTRRRQGRKTTRSLAEPGSNQRMSSTKSTHSFPARQRRRAAREIHDAAAQASASACGGCGRTAAQACSHSRLKSDDLPTFGKPTIPILRLFFTRLAQQTAVQGPARPHGSLQAHPKRAQLVSSSTTFLGGMAAARAASHAARTTAREEGVL